jgi:tRNA(Ile)-lysidine synthase
MAAGGPIGALERNRLLQDLNPPLAVAVSGGPDSVALMHLVADWLKGRSRVSRDPTRPEPVVIVTVDHGLRPESAREAAWVGARAASLGLPHVTLQWKGAKPATGVQEAARKARLALLAEFAGREDLERPREILLAHHLDDQAETLLMRLARGSGIDGLSAMREVETRTWLRLAHPVVERAVLFRRPLLTISKARLVATLEVAGVPYLRDPSNDEPRFERVRLRAAAPFLGSLGLSNDQLATAARRLQAARRALGEEQCRLARSAVTLEHDALACIDMVKLRNASSEVALRLLQTLIQILGGREEPPRRRQLEPIAAWLRTPSRGSFTLAGAMIEPAPRKTHQGDHLVIYREPGRRGLPVRMLEPGQGIFWDHRFYLSLSAAYDSGLEIKPLGPAFSRLRREFPALAALKMPCRAAATLPSAWRGGELLAVPSLGPPVAVLNGPALASEYVLAVRFAPQHTRTIWGEATARSPM